ncbi:MAG: hypothetical protein EAX89_11370 [Candidatus Lokiarchaeota archaeon]|nr:hypothetical protein [Candidatus Lokiarchaeota archaeon]
MKEFSYKINLAIIGTDTKCNEIFLDYLDQISLNSQTIESEGERFFIQNDIPVKLKVFVALTFHEMINNYDQIKKLSILIYVLNINDINSINNLNYDNYTDFCNIFKFKGISALVGVDLNHILEKNNKNEVHINEFSLIQKTQELNFIYCFEVKDTPKDLILLYNSIFKDISLKFSILNPELFEKAKNYGKELQKLKL